MAEMIADPGNDAPDAVANPIELATASLRETFPQLTDDTRQNYTGLMVAPEDLVNVMTYLRDEQGFNYLSSVTGVDLIDDNKMEVVYHVYSTDKGGTAIVLKCQVDRETPNVPSVTPIYPGAEFQEREAYDLFGIIFENHPDLRRILMWDGFEGHPMRKDWKEAFYEEDHKPFGSRWPGGDVRRSEEYNPYGKNVEYPEGWTPSGKEYDVETDMYDISSLDVSYTPMGDIKSDTVTVNIGPQHPSTHGVFRMVVDLDGETVMRLKPVMGYLHRNHEKIGERNSFLQNIPYTDRLDYLSSMSNNHGYVMAVEKLIGSNVPERAEWIRVLVSEMTRIANHLWALGFLLNDLGALQTPMLYFYVERELILDFFESVSGARMMCNYMRFNGLAYDLPHSIRSQETMSFLNEFAYDRMPKAIDEWETLTRGNEIVKARSVGIGVLSKEEAIAYSATGPVLRASGVQYDVRKAEPYSYYDKLDFDIPVRQNGDIFDRYLVRLDEMRESLKIIRQVLPYLDETKGAPILSGKPQYNIRIPNGGDSYARVESPKGELGFYIMSHPKAQNPDRYHVRAPSFINLTPMERMSVGYKLADVVSVLGSIDIVLGEVDR